MRLAWIKNGVIQDICDGDPAERYHPDIAKNYTVEVPEEASNGDGWIDGRLVKLTLPELIPPPAPAFRTRLSPVEFKLLFTPQERIAIRAMAASAEPTIAAALQDFLDIIDDPRLTEVNLNLDSTKEGINFLTTIGILQKDRAEQILRGIPE